MPTFLRAEWRRLLMLNYAVDPALLRPHLPAHTELDLWEGTCYVSVVGFMFEKVRVRGVAIPWHTRFEEVNLRFYVRHHDATDGWRRGVVFLSELVPRPAIAWVANTLYREHYAAVPMWHTWRDLDATRLEVEYGWRQAGGTHSIGVRTAGPAIDLKPGSEAEFITEHYWGYARWDAQRTMQYQVQHPRWQVYPVEAWHCDVDFGAVYGTDFSFLKNALPTSVFLAEGSPVEVAVGGLAGR
jgi:uncharacterized protein